MSGLRKAIWVVLVILLVGLALLVASLVDRELKRYPFNVKQTQISFINTSSCFALPPNVLNAFEGSEINGQLLAQIKKRLMDVPGVDQVEVRSHWLGEVSVRVTWHVPKFRINDYQLQTSTGQFIQSPSRHWLCHQYPNLVAHPEGIEMVRAFYLSVESLLEERHIRKVQLNLSHGYQVHLDNHVLIRLGWKSLTERFQLSLNLLKHRRQVGDPLPEYLDARYSGGIAVKE